MSVAANSPAWLTRSAESRNFFCAVLSGLLGFRAAAAAPAAGGGDLSSSRDFGAEEEDVKARRVCSWKAKGVRRALRGRVSDDMFCVPFYRVVGTNMVQIW